MLAGFSSVDKGDVVTLIIFTFSSCYLRREYIFFQSGHIVFFFSFSQEKQVYSKDIFPVDMTLALPFVKQPCKYFDGNIGLLGLLFIYFFMLQDLQF